LLSNFDIQEAMKYADEGWKNELSPVEGAKELIEFTEDLLNAYKSGG